MWTCVRVRKKSTSGDGLPTCWCLGPVLQTSFCFSFFVFEVERCSVSFDVSKDRRGNGSSGSFIANNLGLRFHTLVEILAPTLEQDLTTRPP